MYKVNFVFILYLNCEQSAFSDGKITNDRVARIESSFILLFYPLHSATARVEHSRSIEPYAFVEWFVHRERGNKHKNIFHSHTVTRIVQCSGNKKTRILTHNFSFRRRRKMQLKICFVSFFVCMYPLLFYFSQID